MPVRLWQNEIAFSDGENTGCLKLNQCQSLTPQVQIKSVSLY
jgi:hypothetical protein